jgi:hypothetical protein
MNKKGEMGESMITIIRIFMVVIISIVIFGISSIFYDYNINIRDSETLIFAKQTVDCITTNGVLNLDSLEEDNIFSFCGFDESETERFFLSIVVIEDAVETKKLIDGDENLLWVRKIYNSELKTDSIEKYEPGYYNGLFPVRVLEDSIYRDAEIRVEVIVKDEI